jgi:hypothetical protein
VLLGAPRVDAHDFCDSTPSISVRATCRPHRLVLYGLVPRSVRSVAVRTSRGLVPGRITRVRGGRRALLLVVPARAAARTLVVTRRGGRVRELPLAAPPAARQCGWRSFGALLALSGD